MKEESLTDKEVISGSADARKTYSAKELAEVYMTSREVFLGLDMKEATQDWNLNFIYSLLYNVRDLSLIDLLINWLAETWAETHHLYDTYTNIKDPKLVENHQRFVLSLKDIKDSLIRRFEAEEHKELLRAQMLGGYHGNDTVTINTRLDSIGKDETQKPLFGGADVTAEPQFHMADFDSHKIGILLISDDDTFSLFVHLLREKIWPKIEENKNKYSNAFRFVLMVNGIIAERSTMPDFDYMLQELIPGIGSQLSSLKQRSDANNKKNLKYYKDPNKKKCDSCWKLTRDCPDLEKLLKPLLDKVA